ncbi:spore cortex-lytic protein [Brevibacillus sp. SYP-B805]|uniref:cell wall hydrolase n=1 Tax=Brevibacillus sp. SYP-B805 TaxID=1578199 RepID=UPI0013EBFB23|nr:cell wall hydrolase [Brevibacillus sp. SYP-B805]NGQ94600.1 spore cortex-lytic protein [Brevibacillus sp. SYP-B805]
MNKAGRRLISGRVLTGMIAAACAASLMAATWPTGESAYTMQPQEYAAPAKAKKPMKTFHPSRLSANDLKLMANAVYGEARGEPYIGQVAIAAVILNRTKSPNFPDTPAGVIFEPRAFTAVADGQIWLNPNESAKKAVNDALRGWDPTGGCVYYFNPATATSQWIWSRPQVKKIGKHIFCR